MRLVLDRVTCAYGGAAVLHEVSLSLEPGQVLCLLGRNGAGKTTTLRTIMGLVRPRSGSISLNDHELTRLRAHEIPRLGVAYVPQGRGLFPFLTVEENLRMGLLVKGAGAQTLAWVFALFPALQERLRQRAGTLSGGEQQMLATARALCANPTFLLMDEPTEGLMPALVTKLLETIQALKSHGVGVLLVEQKVDAALKVADTVVLLETGHIRHQGPAAVLARDTAILLKYLGVTDSGRRPG
jgi:branched-chain amino acid transport system ATP-binding protein